MDKKNVVYIDSEIWGRKKDEILLLAATWMDLEGIMLEEMSKKEREMLYDFVICGIPKAK